jgi:hypothetical protein
VGKYLAAVARSYEGQYLLDKNKKTRTRLSKCGWIQVQSIGFIRIRPHQAKDS